MTLCIFIFNTYIVVNKICNRTIILLIEPVPCLFTDMIARFDRPTSPLAACISCKLTAYGFLNDHWHTVVYHTATNPCSTIEKFGSICIYV